MTGAGLVQIASSLAKINSQEIFCETFLEHIKPEGSAIKLHNSMRHSGRRHPGSPKKFAAEGLIEIAGIFDRVVQMHFLQSVKSLSGNKFSEAQSQCRLIVQTAKTAVGT